jgi:pimeloyl-ACP methyl ester carboxylesterase
LVADVRALIEQGVWYWRGYSIYYQVAGQGQPLLFLHGLEAGMSSRQWEPNMLAFSRHYRCYRLDLLGYGLSERPKIRYRSRLWTELIHDFTVMVTEADPESRPPHVVAAGSSASFVLALAAQRPEQFDNLILLNPLGLISHSSPPGVFRRILYRFLANTRAGGWLARVLLSDLAIHRRVQGLYANAAQARPEAMREYMHNVRVPNSKYSLLAMMSGMANVSVGPLLPKITNPTLILLGSEAGLPVEEGQEFEDRMPNARLVILPRAGILANEEAADEFNRRVIDFLSR